MNGVIKKVVPSRGFGFIAGEDGTDYFFHRDELRGLEFAT
jgi:cold shock CspA family protein